MSELNLRNLKQEAQEELSKEKESPKIEQKLTPRNLDIVVEYDAPDGKTYKDTLVSSIVDSQGRMLMTRVVSRLSSGMVFDELPFVERLRISALARATAQIKDPPEWFEKWVAEDDDLLFYLNEKLMEHETNFFRRNSEESEKGETKRRIRFTVPASSTESTDKQASRGSNKRG